MAKKKLGAAVIRATRLIKKWEGFMPEPYLCPAGVPTIGYGNTRYENGDEVAMDDCSIDRERAEEILIHFVKEVSAQVHGVVKNELKPNQMAALISFTYNVGIGNLKRSTLLKLINKGPENQNIQTEFKRWNKSNGKVLAGLTARRKEEADLWSE